MYNGYKTLTAWVRAPIVPEPGSSFQVLAFKTAQQADPLKNSICLAVKWKTKDGKDVSAGATSDDTLEDCVALLLERVKQIERGEIDGELH